VPRLSTRICDQPSQSVSAGVCPQGPCQTEPESWSSSSSDLPFPNPAGTTSGVSSLLLNASTRLTIGIAGAAFVSFCAWATAASVWPIVRDDEWCSEWKLSESKVYDLGPTGRKPRERP